MTIQRALVPRNSTSLQLRIFLGPQGVELSALSAAVSHFLNCFLSSFPDAVAHLPPDELVSRRKSRKRRLRVPGSGDNNTVWASLTPSELWKSIASEAQNYFHFTFQW